MSYGAEISDYSSVVKNCVENEKYLPVAVKECLGIDAGLSNSTSSWDSESVQSSNAGIENDVNDYTDKSKEKLLNVITLVATIIRIA